MTPATEDTRSVETAWTETLRAELPLDAETDVRRYPNFVFGNPLLTMTDIGPDAAVVLIDRLLDQHPPHAFFEVKGALTTDEWADLKETLVEFVSEGVRGQRRGPAGSFPQGEGWSPEPTGATASDETSGPTGSSSPTGPESSPSTGQPAPTAEGFAADAPDLDGVTIPSDLARAVRDLVEASGLDSQEARQALELVIEDLAMDENGGESPDDG